MTTSVVFLRLKMSQKKYQKVSRLKNVRYRKRELHKHFIAIKNEHDLEIKIVFFHIRAIF